MRHFERKMARESALSFSREHQCYAAHGEHLEKAQSARGKCRNQRYGKAFAQLSRNMLLVLIYHATCAQ
jgi:hypothetical protein